MKNNNEIVGEIAKVLECYSRAQIIYTGEFADSEDLKTTIQTANKGRIEGINTSVDKLVKKLDEVTASIVGDSGQQSIDFKEVTVTPPKKTESTKPVTKKNTPEQKQDTKSTKGKTVQTNKKPDAPKQVEKNKGNNNKPTSTTPPEKPVTKTQQTKPVEKPVVTPEAAKTTIEKKVQEAEEIFLKCKSEEDALEGIQNDALAYVKDNKILDVKNVANAFRVALKRKLFRTAPEGSDFAVAQPDKPAYAKNGSMIGSFVADALKDAIIAYRKEAITSAEEIAANKKVRDSALDDIKKRAEEQAAGQAKRRAAKAEEDAKIEAEKKAAKDAEKAAADKGKAKNADANSAAQKKFNADKAKADADNAKNAANRAKVVELTDEEIVKKLAHQVNFVKSFDKLVNHDKEITFFKKDLTGVNMFNSLNDKNKTDFDTEQYNFIQVLMHFKNVTSMKLSDVVTFIKAHYADKFTVETEDTKIITHPNSVGKKPEDTNVEEARVEKPVETAEEVKPAENADANAAEKIANASTTDELAEGISEMFLNNLNKVKPNSNSKRKTVNRQYVNKMMELLNEQEETKKLLATLGNSEKVIKEFIRKAGDKASEQYKKSIAV